MKNRTSIGLLCLCLLVVSVLGGWLLLRPALAQAPQLNPSAQIGRYSIATTQGEVYFVDTKMGRLWYRDTGVVLGNHGLVKPSWREIPTPAKALN